MLGYGTCRNPECVSDIYAPGKNRSIPGSVCADVSTWKRLRGRIVFLEKMVDKSIQRKDEMAAKSPDRLMPGLSCMSDLIRICFFSFESPLSEFSRSRKKKVG